MDRASFFKTKLLGQAREKRLRLLVRFTPCRSADFNLLLDHLTVTRANSDLDNDGDVDALYSLGGRSFSIRTITGQLVWDSGDAFEQLTSFMFPSNFNASNTSNTRDGRSTSKSPEPDRLTLGKVSGSTLAFIGFERIGGVAVYDISDPHSPDLLDYVNTRNFTNPFNFPTAGDLGPEGLLFIRAEDSPNRKPCWWLLTK